MPRGCWCRKHFPGQPLTEPASLQLCPGLGFPRLLPRKSHLSAAPQTPPSPQPCSYLGPSTGLSWASALSASSEGPEPPWLCSPLPNHSPFRAPCPASGWKCLVVAIQSGSCRSTTRPVRAVAGFLEAMSSSSGCPQGQHGDTSRVIIQYWLPTWVSLADSLPSVGLTLCLKNCYL